MFVAKLMFSKPVLVKTLVPKPTFPEADVLEACVSETAHPVTARAKSDRLETRGSVTASSKTKYSEAGFLVTSIPENDSPESSSIEKQPHRWLQPQHSRLKPFTDQFFGDANDAKIKPVSVLHHRIVPGIFSLFKTQGLYWPRQALNRIFKTARFPLKLLIFVGTSPTGYSLLVAISLHLYPSLGER